MSSTSARDRDEEMPGPAMNTPEDMALENQDEMRLPLDVIVLIAESLAGDRRLKTLAALNRTSHLVHQGTLPALYHTMYIPLLEFRFYVSLMSLPAGWAYTEYLCLYETSLATLHVIEKSYRHHHGLDMQDSNVNVLFPRLVAMRTVNVTEALLRSNRHRVSLAGAVLESNNSLISRIEDPCYEKYVCAFNILDNLDELEFREGGYLVASTFQNCTHFEQNWERQGRGDIPTEAFRLTMDSEEPNDHIDATIQLVFEIMTYSTRPDRRRPFLGFSMKRGLTVTCYRSVFESLVRLYAEHVEHIPSLLAMQIYLEDIEMARYSDMERYMKTLAAIYERHWLHVERDGLAPTPTVRVYARISLPIQYWSVDEPRFGVLQGILEVGQSLEQVGHHLGEVNQEEGFYCQLFEGWGAGDDEGDLIWQDGDFLEPPWNYPCSNAPNAEFWYIDRGNMVYDEF